MEKLLNRSDIPRDVKEAIRNGIAQLKHLKSKIGESEQQYQVIINAIPDPIHVVDRSLRLHFLNEAIKSWLRKLDLETEILNKLFYEAFPFLPDKVQEEYQQVFITGELLVTEEVTNLLEEKIFTEVIKIPLFENGEVDKVITIIRDITKYKKIEETLRESEEKYRALFETAPEAIVIISLEGVILDCNKTGAQMAGVPKEQIIGKPFLALNFLKEEDLSRYIGYLSQIINGEEVEPFEMEITLRGRKTWIEIFTALLKKNNEIQAIQLIAQDITDRKEAENTLRESEKRFTSFMQNLPGVAIIKDPDLHMVFTNRYFEEEFQLNYEEWYGKNNEDLFPPDIAAQFTKTDQQVLTQGSTLELEQVTIRDGVKKNWLTYKFPIRLKDSIFVGGIGINVTERKQAEKELQEAKEKYKMLVEKLHEGVLLEDTQGFISFVNPRVTEMLGYSEDELIGRHWSTIVPVEETNKIKKESAKRPRGISSTYEGNLLAKDGRYVPVIISATSLFTEEGCFQGALSVFTDITERKLMEEVLQQSEEKYRNLVERANDGIAIVQDKQIKYINPALAKMTGFTAEELYDTPFMKYVHLKDLQKITNHYNRRMKGQNAPNIYEATILKNDGTSIDIEVNAGLISYWHKPADLVIIRDITERKHVEEEIKRAHSDLNQIFKAVVPLCVIDRNYCVLRINDTFSSFFHIKKEDVIGKKCYEVWQGVLCGSYECPLKQILGGKEHYEYEADRVLDDNSKISFIVTAVPYRDPDGKILGIIENFTDITERKHAEEALRESEEALRQVKLQEERYHTMLGHFLKNDLHEIVNNLEYFTLANQFDQGLNEAVVDKVMDISFRSSKTIDTVNKIFTVLQSPFGQRQESLNLLEIIQETVSELRLSMAFSHPVIINQESMNLAIVTDRYLKDVFSEILLFVASPTNGEVIIEAEQRPLHFCVSIQDRHSRPISKEVCLRLAGTITDEWESQGHFIGISLASVIMQHYGGQLTIDPSEYNGNKFQLLFPLHLIQTKK
ncbi:MAG: PAS domain S-box protein [Promethearchaeota archaeon]